MASEKYLTVRLFFAQALITVETALTQASTRTSAT